MHKIVGDIMEKRPKWGQRMIKFTIQFFTNNLPRNSDDRTAWDSGAIHIVGMESRNIKHDHVFFHGREELLPKLQELMDRHQIKLVTSEKTKQVRIA